ncbi:MAG TPA: DUF402 domain-containing protein [Candidatus Methanomethylia archaeon]|nr:DUF402 domain-containing protein [Candidatus Methanomethylicia archaeon]
MDAIKLRGIYTTAIAAILVSHGFKIAQPSKVTAERIGESHVTNEAPQAVIIDKADKQGIRIRGLKEVVDKAAEAILEELGDAIVRRYSPGLYSVYAGVVKERREDVYIVELEGGKGILKCREEYSEGQKVLVCVVRPGFAGSAPHLSTQVRVTGRYAYLIRGGRITVSEWIKGWRRGELLNLGRMLKPAGWGIKWRSSAERAKTTELVEEIASLKKRAEELIRRFDEAAGASLLMEGEQVIEMEFPRDVKLKLDEKRGEVAVTVRGHHRLKAAGPKFSALVDLAEELLKKLDVRRELEQILERKLEEWLEKGGNLLIEHSTLKGNVYKLGPGKVQEVNHSQGKIVVLRQFKGRGRYDGLDVPKEEGDYGLTEISLNGWTTTTRYFSKEGELKGIYVNINTPPELYPGRIRYVDLCIDVVKVPGSPAKIIDREELESYWKLGVIGEKLYRKALQEAQKVMERLEAQPLE